MDERTVFHDSVNASGLRALGWRTGRRDVGYSA